MLDRASQGASAASEQLPGLARIVGGAAWRSTMWGADATRRTGRLALRTLADRQASAELLEEVASNIGEAAQTVGDVARRIQTGVPVSEALAEHAPSIPLGIVIQEDVERPPAHDDLRGRGRQLLDHSRDVWYDDDTHPAFARILDDLAPDEARILVLLARGGPQPSVDVRTGGPLGRLSSDLIAPGLTMIGPRAGVRHLDRVPAYLNNLDRLGMIWLSQEPVDDPEEYQVVEAQPYVLAAMHSVRFSRVVRRSIQLTPFGDDFCRTCLLDEDENDLPEHLVPPEPDES